jgi:hypothetical protein
MIGVLSMMTGIILWAFINVVREKN